MVPAACLALLLAGPPTVDGAVDPRADARVELDACARRIEELKARRRLGLAVDRELERLLRRARELEVELQRTRVALPLVPAAPSPEELRERADAARDEADRLAAEIAELDVKLGDARRLAQAEADPAMTRAAFGGARPPGARPSAARVLELQLRRAMLADRRARAEEAAARLEGEADAAEADR